MKRKIVVGVTGASGAIYAKLLLQELLLIPSVPGEIAVIFTSTAKEIWKYELEDEFKPVLPIKIYENDDFFAPFASGSSPFDTLIACPCSMGTLGRIAGGISDDLITRTADVMLKERRRLILVPRESPLNLIQIENMRTITMAGGIICPASPSFYSNPQNIGDAVKTVIFRVLDLAGFENDSYRWTEKKGVE